MTAAARLGAMALACLAALAAALVTQHVYGMQPCPWCVLQRAIFLAIALVCGVAAIARTRMGVRIAGALGLLLAACGAAAALWQHFVAAASSSCNLTLADRIVSGIGLDSALPDVFAARASCADAAVALAGVPYEFWSLLLFVLIAAGAASVLRKSGSAR